MPEDYRKGGSMKRRLNQIIITIMNKIAHRSEYKTYLGYGDFETERGWYLFEYWISAERFLR